MRYATKKNMHQTCSRRPMIGLSTFKGSMSGGSVVLAITLMSVVVISGSVVALVFRTIQERQRRAKG